MTTKDKRQPAFTDTDPMPFGKHRGEPLQDVPARYLAWLWRDGLREYSQNRPGLTENSTIDMPHALFDKYRLANYIHNSKSAIEQEIGETL